MQKITSVLVLMLFLGAAMAGCTGEEIEQTVDTVDDTSTDSTSQSGAKFVYIQSHDYGFGIQDAHPLSLHFPAPPMADNSPYELEQICSVENGDPVDVYSTHVDSSFNTITSWSVKNDNGIELDHFKYDSWGNAADFVDLMVVFEDNTSWDGHIGAEVFDQKEWVCDPSGQGSATATYTSDQILALMGADGSEDAALDFDSVGLNEPKFGVVMTMIGPGDSLGLEEETGMEISGDVTITMSNMYDDDAQRLHNGMSITYGVDFGGSIMPITMQMSESQGPYSVEGAGIINKIMTNENTLQPEGKWLVDYIWDYNAAKIQMGMAEEPCNGNGEIMESMGEMGPHCMCDDGFDWDDGDMMTCVTGDDIDWESDYETVPSDNEFSATISAAQVFIDGFEQTGGQLAAFNEDGVISGLDADGSTFFPPAGTNIYDFSVWSNSAEGEVMTFKFYDAENNVVIDLKETYIFISNGVVGNANSPFELTADSDTSHSFWCSDEVGGEADMKIEFELVNDGKEDCGDGSDEPQDMDPSTDSDGDGDLTNDVDNWYTCINGDSIPMNLVNDGNNDCSYAEDEGGMDMEPTCYDGDGNEIDCDDMMGDIIPELPEPSAAELLGATWTDSLDEVTGIQSFTGVVNMESVGEDMTITLAIMPTVPPKVTGLTMTNGTVTYSMSFLYGDDVVIDIVDSDTDGWNKGASDFMLNPHEIVFHEELCTNTENEDATLSLQYGGYEECTSFSWQSHVVEQSTDGIDNDGDGEIDESDEEDYAVEECYNDWTEEVYSELSMNECNAFEGTIVHDTMIDFELWGQIEVPDSQLEVHILTPAYDEDGNEIEQDVLANFTVANQPWDTEDVPVIGTWTNDDGAEWTIYWRCDDSENHPSIVQEECMIQMTTSDMVEMTDVDGETYMGGPSTNFDVKLYDTWAEDYTGNAMPSFTLGLTIIALLGSCLLVQRRKTE